MFEYMTAKEAAAFWKISVRRVQRLCKDNLPPTFLLLVWIVMRL